MKEYIEKEKVSELIDWLFTEPGVNIPLESGLKLLDKFSQLPIIKEKKSKK